MIYILHNMQDGVQKMNNNNEKILTQKDLYEILPFGKTKINKLIQSNELPLVKIGKDYITTFNILEKWMEKHLGEEIYY